MKTQTFQMITFLKFSVSIKYENIRYIICNLHPLSFKNICDIIQGYDKPMRNLCKFEKDFSSTGNKYPHSYSPGWTRSTSCISAPICHSLSAVCSAELETVCRLA